MRRLSLNRSEPAKKSGQNIPKNRCRTTIAERMVETLAELPFIGDQVVCLSHDQARQVGWGRKRAGPKPAQLGEVNLPRMPRPCMAFDRPSLKITQIEAAFYGRSTLRWAYSPPDCDECDQPLAHFGLRRPIKGRRRSKR